MTKRSAEYPEPYRSRNHSTELRSTEKESGEGEVLCIILAGYLLSYFILYLLLA